MAVGILAAIASLFLAFLAIFGKEFFRKLKFEYEISKIDQQTSTEGDLLQILRVKIQNVGRRAASNVLVTVTEIFDKKNNRYHKREDFIHMPLQWTHYSEKKARNIAVREEAYVDFGQNDLFDPGLKLYTNPLTSAEQLFLIKNDAKITLRINEEYGFTEEIKLALKFDTAGGAGLELVSRRKTNSG